MQLTGIYPPLATPFVNQELALDLLAENVRQLAPSGLKGFVALGSNGELPALTESEKLHVLETVVSSALEDSQVIVGVGYESTRQALAFITAAAARGAHAALVLPPSYYKSALTPDVLRDYYATVADSADLPLLIYNMPANTGINLGPDVVVPLAQHPRIIGLKDSSGNIVQITEIIRQTQDEEFAVMAGSASFLFTSLCVGAAGGVAALANLAPRECVQIFNHFQRGEINEARALQFRLMAPNAAVTTRFGVAGLKAAMTLCGYHGGEPRHPLIPLPNVAHEAVRAILAEAYLLPKDESRYADTAASA
ncbi:MAG: dihydrodipicolinate synthase family protein [Chloroflexi bacterium]|nr:dihydrodipicolinate synthase family protein [Chloroflexota bacterium]